MKSLSTGRAKARPQEGFQFWLYFSQRQFWPEKKPPAWLLSGIEVKRDAARETGFQDDDAR